MPLITSVKAPEPSGTDGGDRLVMVGTGFTGLPVTTRSVVLVAVPPGVVTAMRPVDEEEDTTKESCVALSTLKLPTDAPLSVTEDAALKLVPVTVTVVPATALAGAKLPMVGAGPEVEVTKKLNGADVPPLGPGLVTVTG